MSRRIHITGASGSGTSTLARTLADRLGSQAFDTDDFYWHPSDPPFQDRRTVGERLRLMDEMFIGRPDWVLSGSLHTWGTPVMEHVTHVVFLTLNPAARLARLRKRERMRFGARIARGGDLEAKYRGFLEWAMAYDEPDTTGRSRAAHDAWLAGLDLPVVRLDGARPVVELADRVMEALADPAPAA